ncbi:hypothetical protein AUJ84_00090 [Candidatus Pacearchaeota archaeon CG1_02_32_132]|nr:MAG: hypothetical protein AUJ84_00090 [Candidatus Pacearchaeota archaeon CG1_02_32_132]
MANCTTCGEESDNVCEKCGNCDSCGCSCKDESEEPTDKSEEPAETEESESESEEPAETEEPE